MSALSDHRGRPPVRLPCSMAFAGKQYAIGSQIVPADVRLQQSLMLYCCDGGHHDPCAVTCLWLAVLPQAKAEPALTFTGLKPNTL